MSFSSRSGDDFTEDLSDIESSDAGEEVSASSPRSASLPSLNLSDEEDDGTNLLLSPPSIHSSPVVPSILANPLGRIVSNSPLLPAPSEYTPHHLENTMIPVSSQGDSERSPLLQRQPSISFATPPSPRALRPRHGSHALARGTKQSSESLRLRQHDVDYGKPKNGGADAIRGNSTFGQSLFNSIAILLGVGILSEPFAFAKAGWISGTIITIGFGFLTCYTAKILARFIYDDPSLRTYADCSRKAFGPKSTVITSCFFFIELFTVSVVLVVLFSDSMHAVIPAYSSDTWKLASLVILVPTAFLPLAFISYTSLLSVFATVFIGIVLIIDGLSKQDAPGSLFDFAETDLLPISARGLGLSFGIFMAGFAGHAVVPSLARDMKEPEHFDTMINYAFVITTCVYGIVGAAGYLMFGQNVTDEISRDLLSTPGYNVAFTRTGMWMLVISPITKFALSSRPLNIMLEILLDIEPTVDDTRPPEAKPRPRRRSSGALSDRLSIHDGVHEHVYGHEESVGARSRKALLFIAERLALVLIIVFVAIAVPQFGVVMSLLGAFSAFTLCVIGPLGANIAINGGPRVRGWRGVIDMGLLTISIVMGAWGTAVCVLDQWNGL